MRGGYDYLAVGHLTVDVLADGSRRPGGTVLYSALQAARLGLRAAILTRGERAQVERLLAPYAAELEVILQPSPCTTTLATEGTDAHRRQRVLAWAAPMRDLELPRARIVHLAPVAAELAALPAHGRCFLGLTPQGLTRSWAGRDAAIESVPAGRLAERIAARCDAMVLSEHEHSACAGLIEVARAAGATVALTAGASPARVYHPGGEEIEVSAVAIERPVDDLGAGDVYASVFFIELHDGREPYEAARRAACAAGLRMLGRGPAAIADGEAIEQRLHAASFRSSRSSARTR